jgi:hypothetical protein
MSPFLIDGSSQDSVPIITPGCIFYNSLDETQESLNYRIPGSPQMTSSPKLNKHKNVIKHKRRPTDTEKMRIVVCGW